MYTITATGQNSSTNQQFKVVPYSGGRAIVPQGATSYVFNRHSNTSQVIAWPSNDATVSDSKVEFLQTTAGGESYYIKLSDRNLFLTANGDGSCYWKTYTGSNAQIFKLVEVGSGGTNDNGNTGGDTEGNYSTYPCKTMRILQNHRGTTSHSLNNGTNVTSADYPFDESCDDTGRSWMFCPCDEITISRIYTGGTNTIWFRSSSPVKMPCGTDYLVIMVIHPDTEDLNRLGVGQKFTRGQAMIQEGKSGANANHFHIACGKGNLVGNGWVQNNFNKWVLTSTNGNITADQAFYLDSKFTTTILNNGGYSFKAKP